MTEFTCIRYHGGPIGEYDPVAIEEFLSQLRGCGGFDPNNPDDQWEADPRIVEHPCWPLVVVTPGHPSDIRKVLDDNEAHLLGKPLDTLDLTVRLATLSEVQKWQSASGGVYESVFKIVVRGAPLALEALQFLTRRAGVGYSGWGNLMTITAPPGTEQAIRDLVGVFRVEVLGERVVATQPQSVAEALLEPTHS